MTTDYDPIAEQYKLSKQQPWRLYVESYVLLELAGDLADQDVIDLACGEAQVLNLNNSTQKKRPKRAMLWAIVK
jgi:hypothetical protein